MSIFPMGKKYLAAVCTGIMLAASPLPTQATGFPVVDVSNLLQNLLTAEQTLRSLENDIMQMQTFTSSSYSGVNGLLGSNSQDLSTLLNQVTGISYSLGTINSQYKRLFPDRASWQNMPQSQYGQYYQNWNTELSESARNAMNAQTLINRIQTNNTSAADILARSNGANGEVRQLQAQNQMLGVMSSQLSDVTTTLVTSSRVTATAAAVSASKAQAERETAAQLREGYTNRGAPSRKLPGWE